MRCSTCGSRNTRTTNSRPCAEDAVRRRRYVCRDCGARFSSVEIAVPNGAQRTNDMTDTASVTRLLVLPAARSSDIADELARRWREQETTTTPKPEE